MAVSDPLVPKLSPRESEVLALAADGLTDKEIAALDQASIKEVRERGMSTPYDKEYITKSGERIRVRRAGALLSPPDLAVSYTLAVSAPAVSSHAEQVHKFGCLIN